MATLSQKQNSGITIFGAIAACITLLGAFGIYKFFTPTRRAKSLQMIIADIDDDVTEQGLSEFTDEVESFKTESETLCTQVSRCQRWDESVHLLLDIWALHLNVKKLRQKIPVCYRLLTPARILRYKSPQA